MLNRSVLLVSFSGLMADDDTPAPLLFTTSTERRILDLMQYGFWTGALGVGLALVGALFLYALTALGTLLAAGCAVGGSMVLMLTIRLVQLRGLRNTIWPEWAFILASGAFIVALTVVLEWVLP
jgi:hypothetical protein